MASINFIALLFSIQPYLLFSLLMQLQIAVDDTGVVVEFFVVALPIKSFLSYLLKIAAALGTLI